MKRLVIYGCGGHGREMAFAARATGRQIVFMDDQDTGPCAGVEQIRFAELERDDELCIAVGNPSTRRDMAERVSAWPAATIIDPTAAVDLTARIGEGAQICGFCYVGSLVSIGRQFQCNVGSHVHHDCVIGDFVTFSPGTICLGNVHVGDDVFVGAGAVIRNGSSQQPLIVGDGAVIGMGAIVTKDVPPGSVVAGNPARLFDEGHQRC